MARSAASRAGWHEPNDMVVNRGAASLSDFAPAVKRATAPGTDHATSTISRLRAPGAADATVRPGQTTTVQEEPS